MNKFTLLAMLIFILFSFFIHLLALMRVFPLLLSIPILFISYLAFFSAFNQRKKFKGF